MVENQEMESYRIHDGVLYVRDFKEKPDYFQLGGFDGITACSDKIE